MKGGEKGEERKEGEKKEEREEGRKVMQMSTTPDHLSPNHRAVTAAIMQLTLGLFPGAVCEGLLCL